VETTIPTYSVWARCLHWLVAVFVFVAWPMGFLLSAIKDDVKLFYYGVHESCGFVVLWLMVARLVVRLLRRPPLPLPAPPITVRVSKWVHVALYVSLFLQPITGFLATNAHGFPFSLFGVIPIPSPIGKNPDIAPVFSAIHDTNAFVLLTLFFLHFGGVLFHRLFLRDRILERMT
jgi:cytochrome b561